MSKKVKFILLALLTIALIAILASCDCIKNKPVPEEDEEFIGDDYFGDTLYVPVLIVDEIIIKGEE